MATSIYQQMLAAGVQCENHETDLYVPVNETTTAIIKDYQFKSNVQRFISQIDNKPWYDIPFAFDPAWEAKRRKPT